MANLYCRVCGNKHEEPHWGENEDAPTYFICPCCGVEAGYEDDSLESIREYRAEWLAAGAPRFLRNHPRPEGWSLARQMEQIPEEFR